MREAKKFEELKYLISYPENFDRKEKYPLVIFLHGAGTRGDNLDLVSNNACFQNLVKRQSERGYVVLAPQCSGRDWNEFMSYLIGLVDYYRDCEFVDNKRIYLTGNSMGGYGTWELATIRAGWFAAIMPICGGGTPWMASNLKNTPIRTFHGVCDPTVDPTESLKMVRAVNVCGGNAELILFPKLAHNCWDEALSDESNYDWLLSHSLEGEGDGGENLSGKNFG